MSLASYDALTASIASWLRRADLTAMIPDFVVLCEATMNRDLRTTLQLIRATYTISGEFVAKPSGFRMLRTLRLTSGSGSLLSEMTLEDMAKRKAQPGTFVAEPRRYAALGSQFEFWPAPDQAYSAVMEYQGGFTPLSSTNETNWILNDHPDAYLFGSLVAANAYVKNDERAALFKGEFDRVIAEIQDSLRTTYDRTLRADAGLMANRSRSSFNILTGDC